MVSQTEMLQVYQSYLIQDFQAPPWLEREFSKALSRISKDSGGRLSEDSAGLRECLAELDQDVVCSSLKEGIFYDYQCRVRDSSWLVDYLPRKSCFVGGEAKGRLLGESIIREKVAEKCDFNYLRIVAEDWNGIQDKKGWLEKGLGF